MQDNTAPLQNGLEMRAPQRVRGVEIDVKIWRAAVRAGDLEKQSQGWPGFKKALKHRSVTEAVSFVDNSSD